MTYPFNPRICRLISKCSVLVAGGLLHLSLSAESPIEFNRDIRPILSDNCYLCHGPDKSTREANLRLDIEDGLSADLGNGRQAVVAGNPAGSELINRIFATDADEVMPPPSSHKDLSNEEKNLLKQWIAEGAAWQDHWSLAQLERPAVPDTESGWGANPIDAFILKRLEKENLQASGEADKRTLIRRASYDLRGLPPTETEVEAFLNDSAAGAYERLLDRLLASREYGEHRARYWLDAARYSDTHGFHLDNYRSIWPYRDWVVKAFNENMPFDQFTIEQIAGDMLADPTQDQLIATGFNRCNPTTSEGGAIDDEYYAIYAQDRVETTATVWLGMTASCAACHDHKFDPVSQKEFYELTAFFRNTTQKAMDQNIWDTQPSIKVFNEEEQARIEDLKSLIKEKERTIAELQEGKDVAHANISMVARDVLDAHMDPSEVSEASGDFEKDSPFTVAFWIRIPEEAKDDNRTLLGRFDPKNRYQGWGMRLLKDQILELTLTDDDTDSKTVSVKTKKGLDKGEWNHVAFTFNGMNRYYAVRTVYKSFGYYLNGEKAELRGMNHRARLKGSIRNDQPFAIGDRKGAKKKDDSPAIELGRISMFNDVLSQPEMELLASSRDFPLEDARPAGMDILVMGELRELQRQLDLMEANAPVTLVMKEKTDSEPEARILERGQYDLPGERVTPNVPAALPPLPEGMNRDRLALAKWLVDPGNPLPARVTVNRFWQELFGTGIVKTSEDFGSQGEPPSHPELLDWLASEFIESGWDIKHMYKLVMLSSTYRQSSNVNPDLAARDPDNRLLARGPRYRLDAEVIRDQALFLSDSMVDTMGGPPVKPYQPMGVWYAVAYSGSNTVRFEQDHGEKLYRRSLYTFWKRTAPPPSMSIFDAPSRESCSVRRERTNTPLQALVLMNDPQFVEAARRLAEVVLTDSREDKFSALMSIALGQELSDEARAILQGSYDQLLAYYREHPGSAKELIQTGESNPDGSIEHAVLAAWTMIASQIMNMDAFVTKS
ncbi:MAG: DUF1553 domain-containing protein [Puniceicoccaceae bacterium]